MKSDTLLFKAPLDKLAKVLTAASIIVFAIVVIVQFNAFWPEKKGAPIISVAIVVVVLMFSYLFSPQGYQIRRKDLVILRPFKNVHIDRTNIESVEQLDNGALKFSIRTFGVGGLFGYYGYFVNQRLGKMLWYASRRDHAVLIQTHDQKKIIITPDNPELFVRSFSDRQQF